MLDVGLTLSLLLALWRAVRLRHPVVLGAVMLAIYLWVMDALNVLALPRQTLGTSQIFLSLLVGPSARPERAQGVLPSLSWWLEYPLTVRLTRLLVLGGAVFALERDAKPLRPDTPRARALNTAGSPIVFFMVMEAIVVIVGLLALRLTRDVL